MSRITVTPETLTLAVAAKGQLMLTVFDANGNPIPIDQVPPAKWTTSDSTKVAVTPTGGVQAIAVGTATITATVVGRSASVVVTVVP